MGTIKSYTDIPQSKKLAEILLLESADYFHAPDAGIVVTEPYKLNQGDETVITAYKGAIPCWSLAALINILPYPQLSKDKLGSGKERWMISTYPDNCRFDSYWHENPIDACYEMILKLHELNLL